MRSEVYCKKIFRQMALIELRFPNLRFRHLKLLMISSEMKRIVGGARSSHSRDVPLDGSGYMLQGFIKTDTMCEM